MSHPLPTGAAPRDPDREPMSRLRIDVFADAETRLKTMATDALQGLTDQPKWLPPKYFYDPAGSRLFDEITRLPEYYLTRTEEALLTQVAPGLMRTLGPSDMVELGSGFSAKTLRLLEARSRDAGRFRYTPVDLDADTVAAAARRLLRRYGWLEVHAVIGDFERDLLHVPPPAGRRLAVFLGSTIGNLDAAQRRNLLLAVRGLLGTDGHLLLGVDLVKAVATLEAAYDDAAGVTAAFNRNVLDVLNRDLGADFRPEAYRHHAWYNAPASRIEMHLVAETRQVVRLRRIDLTIEVAAGESIWTENSYKFTRTMVETMLHEAGLRLVRWITDEAGWFGLVVAAPR